MKRLTGFISAAAFAVLTAACAQTDTGITTKVKGKLVTDDLVKAYQVDVTTHDHVVTLSGKVETQAAKDQALRLARETEGVRDVIDQLRVTETAATSGADTDLGDDLRRGAEATKDALEKGRKPRPTPPRRPERPSGTP